MWYLELLLAGQLHPEDDVQVLVAAPVVPHQDVASRGAVEADVSHGDALLLQPGPHGDDDVARTQLQRGEVPAAVDRHRLRQHLVEDLHLLGVQTVEPLIGFGFRHAAALEGRRTRRACYDITHWAVCSTLSLTHTHTHTLSTRSRSMPVCCVRVTAWLTAFPTMLMRLLC